MPMGAIQVKDVPPELHDALRSKARAQGRTIGQYVLELIRQDLQRPDDAEWMAAWKALEPVEGIDVVGLLAEERSARGDELVRRAGRL
jgi:hypothetical protein